MRFIITAHTDVDGVRLSLDGAWGNMPFDSDTAAVQHAQRVAGRDRTATVERKHYRAPRAVA